MMSNDGEHHEKSSDLSSAINRVGSAKQPPTHFQKESPIGLLITSVPHQRELARVIIAVGLLFSLVGTIGGTFAYVFWGPAKDEKGSKDLITLLWTSQVGLVGSALGFYFGNQSKDSREQ